MMAGLLGRCLHILVGVEVGDMGDEVFVDTVLAVGTADARLLHAGMEALDGLEVLAVDVGLAELQFAAGLHGDIQILGEDA